MGGASSYYSMLAICGFLSAAWFASKGSRLVGVSSIVLEISTGVILGPQVVGLMPKQYAECEHRRHAECTPPSDAEELAKAGQTLGYLDLYNNHDFCDIATYSHGAGHGSSALGHDSGAAGDHGDSAAAGHGGDDSMGHGSTASAGHGSTASAGHGSTASAGHGSTSADHGSADSAGHGSAASAGHSSADAGHSAGSGVHTASDDGRRLSGGGSFDSFTECLEKTCEAEVAHHCGLTPDMFTLIGHTGVALMIFESGMHFDFEKAKVVGLPACCVAVLGTILPLIAGSILMVAFGRPFMPDGVSAGTALAPTSVGIALRLLGEAGVLQKDFGQAIITAAFVDDILSLVLFNVLFSLGGEFDVFKTVFAPIIGIAFMLAAMVAAVKFWPKFIDEVLIPMAPGKRDGSAKGLKKIRLEKDELLFLMQIILLVVYSFITHLLGTHLWGCFIAGMSFACLSPPHHAHHVWVKQTKRMTSWMIRIFFACTVAFSIPVAKLISITAFWKGSILGIFACILTKVCCAPFMGPARWVIGWAMVGRAEFAYLIAQMALSGNMLNPESFAIVIWALLYATIFAPFVFRYLLNKYVASQGLLSDPSDDDHGHAAVKDEEPEESFRPGKMDYSNAPMDRLGDLNDIDIEGVKGSHLNRRKGEDDYSAPLPTTMGAARGGHADGHAASGGAGNGFLCCLFFKKIIVQ